MDGINNTPLPWLGDEFHGQGGSYLFDPKTGKRTLVERTEIPVPVAGGTDQQPGAAGAEKE